MEFNLTSRTHDPLALRDWVETGFAKRLRELPGVATVEITGGTVREILVMPDQRRLAGYGLSFEDLLQAIRKNPEVDSRVSQSPVKKRTRREPMLSGSLAAVAAVPVSTSPTMRPLAKMRPAPLKHSGTDTSPLAKIWLWVILKAMKIWWSAGWQAPCIGPISSS